MIRAKIERCLRGVLLHTLQRPVCLGVAEVCVSVSVESKETCLRGKIDRFMCQRRSYSTYAAVTHLRSTHLSSKRLHCAARWAVSSGDEEEEEADDDRSRASAAKKGISSVASPHSWHVHSSSAVSYSPGSTVTSSTCPPSSCAVLAVSSFKRTSRREGRHFPVHVLRGHTKARSMHSILHTAQPHQNSFWARSLARRSLLDMNRMPLR